MPTLALDGTDLYYEDDGAGAPVLLMHRRIRVMAGQCGASASRGRIRSFCVLE
jgi:hypothetical protein